MKIYEICEDFVPSNTIGRMISEIVDTGHPSSNKFYDLGDPLPITYTDEQGDKKSGMVILCPRCGGTGNNTSKTLSRLHGTFITQAQADKFGGSCHTKRQDMECVGGLMRDRQSGRIIWPHTEMPSKKDNTQSSTITIDSFRSEYPKEYGYYLILKNKFNEGGFIADGDKKRLISLMDKIDNNEAIDIRYVENWLRRLVKDSEMRPDPDRKYKNPNKGKGEGKNVDKRVNPNTFRKTNINR